MQIGSWEVPAIFALLQRRGEVSDEEMRRTFNLGIGLTCVVRPEMVAAAEAALPEIRRVGTVVAVDAGGARVGFV